MSEDNEKKVSEDEEIREEEMSPEASGAAADAAPAEDPVLEKNY